ncbi:alpha/beta hydrolase family protein [Fodinicurvata halophila]|uniref:hypothetical protein n=1 Tax=Fodinicurvata halophila TaxID=1419723 RepID=UPI0036291A32
MKRQFWPAFLALPLALLLSGTATASHFERLLQEWPSRQAVDSQHEEVTLTSHSPFMLSDVGEGPEANPKTEISVDLYLPETASAETPVPAVVLLHGASGVSSSRELLYARQFAEMGIAAAVVDVFAPGATWPPDS